MALAMGAEESYQQKKAGHHQEKLEQDARSLVRESRHQRRAETRVVIQDGVVITTCAHGTLLFIKYKHIEQN